MLNRDQFHRVLSGGMAALAGAALAVPAMTYDAPPLGYEQSTNPADAMRTQEWRAMPENTNQPRWTHSLSHQFEGYHDISHFDRQHPASSVLVQGSHGDPHPMKFDKAWDLNHDKSNWGNDVWVLGGRA